MRIIISLQITLVQISYIIIAQSYEYLLYYKHNRDEIDINIVVRIYQITSGNRSPIEIKKCVLCLLSKTSRIKNKGVSPIHSSSIVIVLQQ